MRQPGALRNELIIAAPRERRHARRLYVLTEETQHGWACRLGALFFPRRMLAQQAASGAP
jgi:hypothetical protein